MHQIDVSVALLLPSSHDARLILPGFILSADDFGLTAGVSRGILELLGAGKLSATGAMTNRPHWKNFAPELMAHAKTVDIGVHLNLTCAAPLSKMKLLAPNSSLPRLGTIARAALTSPAARAEIAAEIARQLDAFADVTGHTPDFVDGHQHVHALPFVRDVVIAAMRQRYLPGTVYLRDPSDSTLSILRRGVCVKKALIVKALAAGLAARAKTAGIPVNHGFSGFSDFDPKRNFTMDLASNMLFQGDKHLIMCHPGFVDDELLGIDSVVETREIELEALLRHSSINIVRYCNFDN